MAVKTETPRVRVEGGLTRSAEPSMRVFDRVHAHCLRPEAMRYGRFLL